MSYIPDNDSPERDVEKYLHSPSETTDMLNPTKDDAIRAHQSIKESTAKIEDAARALAIQGRHEEAQAIEAAINSLKQSLARIRVCEDGKVVTVQ